MVFDWAVYGYRKQGGHGWLRGSLASTDLTSTDDAHLKRFTDLTPHYAEQAEWTPYFAARPIGDRYFLTFTQPEPGAVRAGSVITRVITAPQTMFGEITDLRPLLTLLRESGEFDDPAGRMMELPESEQGPPLSLREGAEIAAMFVSTRGKRIVVPSVDLWHDRLPSLWGLLWPEARSTLSFRPYLTPQALPDPPDPPDVIVLSRVDPVWQTTEWLPRTYNPGVSVPVVPVIETLVQDSARSATGIAHALTGNVRDLHRAHAVASALQRLEADENIVDAAYALRFLPDLPLRPDFQAAAEEDLRQSIIRLLPAAGPDALMPLQALPRLEGLPEAIQAWITRHAPGEVDIVEVVRSAANPRGWFEEALQEGVAHLPADAALAQRVLAWWNHEPEARWVFEVLPRSLDSVLAAGVAGCSVEDSHELQKVARQRHLWQLHAALAAREGLLGMESVQACTPPAHLAPAFEVARGVLGNKAFLGWAVTTSSGMAHRIAAQAVVSDSKLMAGLDIVQAGWLEVWATALEHLSDPFVDVPQPAAVTRGLLDAMLSGQFVPDVLLQRISLTSEANLLEYPGLERAWDFLPEGFHTATVTTFLRSPVDPGPTFPRLLNALRLSLRGATISPEAAWRLLRDHGGVLGSDEVGMLTLVFGEALPSDVVSLIQSLPHWQTGQRRSGLLAHMSARVQWRFRSRLSPVEQVRLADKLQHKLEEHIWWRALPELAAQIAGDGPARVWQRAGGEKKHLPTSGSVLDQWTDVAELLRAGCDPDVQALMHELEAGRPRNADLCALISTRPVS